MLQKISFLLLSLITVVLTLFLNGNISFFQQNLPPAGKLLNPFGGLWQCGELKNTAQEEVLTNKAVTAPIKIHYDDRGVPHIYAQSMEDAIFAQGYVEARDRAFQMDFTMRASSGRLSEILGEVTLGMDRRTLQRGMVSAAEKAEEMLKDLEGFHYAELFAAGANAYLNERPENTQPFEAKFLDYTIEDWSAFKTILIRMYMSEYLNGYSDDIENSNLLAILGRETFDDLFPLENPSTVPIVRNQSFDSDSILKADNVKNDIVIDTFLDQIYQDPLDGIGSNNWAINAKKTKNKRPIYSSDPHLTLNLPSIWYEMQIHTPKTSVHGVKIVGVPGLMMGFNEHVAWGETNLGHDQTDYFTIEWIDRDKGLYRLDGEAVAVEKRIETIKVKGQEDVVDTIYYTHWGPITHWSNDGKHDLAMKWIIQDGTPKPELLTFIEMMEAKHFEDYKEATGKFIGPPQNFGFASSTDTVAIRVNGDLPLRSEEDGRFVEKGDKRTNAWSEIIPRDQNPIIINPEDGFVTSSNQRSADEHYPYFYFGRFSDYRNRSLDTFLRAKSDYTLEDVAKLQYNSFSFLAYDLCPSLLDFMVEVELNEEEKPFLDVIVSWDYYYTEESKAASFFERWLRNIRNNTWDEISQYRNRMDIRYPDTWRLVDLIKNRPDYPFFDHLSSEEKEDAGMIVRKSFKDAVKYFKQNGDLQEWAESKPMNIYHLMRIPGLSEMNISTPGCKNCINATTSTFGPSWRMIVELGEKPIAKGIFPGGQSGNPASKWYKTGIEKWSKGEYFDLNLYKDSKNIPVITKSVEIKPVGQ